MCLLSWCIVDSNSSVFSLFLSDCTFFFFKQKTAYEMRISDWSSDVCSSDLARRDRRPRDRRFPRCMEQLRHAGGRQHQRHRAPISEQVGASIDVAHINEHMLREHQLVEHRAIARQGPLVVGTALQISADWPR